MQQRVTEHFRQQKPHTEQSARGNKKQVLPELPGAYGEGAVTNFDIDAEERMLREFDLATQYGPATDLTRLERWERAAKFGLNPPQHIRSLLMGPQGDQRNNNIWHGRV